MKDMYVKSKDSQKKKLLGQLNQNYNLSKESAIKKNIDITFKKIGNEGLKELRKLIMINKKIKDIITKKILAELLLCIINFINIKIKNIYNRNNIYKNNIKEKNKNKFNSYKQKINLIMCFLIIFVLIMKFGIINSYIKLPEYKINPNIRYNSYEIILKVKGTGIKNILSISHSHIYPSPSNIYINNELILYNINYNYINITEPNSEIKIEWNNTVITNIKGMFYNCIEIEEIDMTKFDTSLVTDMSELFSLCYSLKSLNVSNLNTTNVQTMENMFYKCTNLTSLNLESFIIPYTTSLYRMFYDCINLEYINIKNFEETLNINKDEMFHNIKSNAVICSLPCQCQPPTNFYIDSLTTTEVKISWVNNGFNKFIISYGLQSLLYPENGNKINVNNQAYYTFTNLNSGTKYNIYIKTVCGDKSSSWVGPLLISFSPDYYTMSRTGTNSITTCSKVICDPGGPNNDYYDNIGTNLIIYPETSQKLVTIKGSFNLESCCDHLYIYNGIGTSELLLGRYTGTGTIPLLISTTGPLTIRFTTDGSVVRSGFQLTVSCMHTSQTIYDLINSNNCFKISCDNNWRNIQNLIVSDTGECVNDCLSTRYMYQYRGKCYINCPEGTSNNNYRCYSNSVLEKCEEYSIESEYENLCIKCNNNYYPMFNDQTNKNNFINCYRNNSLEKYYLDNNDLIFKLCYNSCKTCIQNGTIEYHNCITCDINYEFNLTSGEYYNCYPKCEYYYYFDKEKNFICLNETECPSNYNNLIEEKNQCIDECDNDSKFKYHFRKKCYQKCPEKLSYESETKRYFCEVRCTKEIPLEIVEYQNCTDFCGINEMYNRSCISKYQDEDTNGNLILKNILLDITSTNFDISLLSNNKNIIINESFISFIITNNKIQKNFENQIINLGNCENILKNEYRIDNDEELVILLINIDKNDEHLNKSLYEIYSKTDENKLKKLDLNLCENVTESGNKLLDNNYIIKCANYSIDSIINNACITCAESYYPKYDDIIINQTFIKCYKNIEGYYLDKNNNNFKKCYESCQLCEKEGNITHHNCIKCKKDYFYELNISSYLNCYDKCEFNFYYDENNKKYYCTPDDNCVNYFDKIISEKNQCIDDCKKDSVFPFEFQKKCYNICPINISQISNDKNHCEIKCPKDLPYELIETQTCVKECTISQLNNKLCKINFKNDNKSETNDAQEKMVENIRNEITNGIDISGIDKGNDIMIQEKDITITITKNTNQKKQINSKTNISSIDLGECEKKLKDEYNIPKNGSLYILKMDVKQDGYKIPKIQYEVYYPLYNDSKLYLLNLSICDDTDIDIYLPFSLNGNLDQIDPNSDFYNDICNTFTSEDGTDLTLSERKKNYVNNNLTVSEENCNFIGYNETTEKAICSCQTKTNFISKISENSLIKENLYKNFVDFKNLLNIKVLKCINLIFSLEAFKNNYANIILIIIIIVYFICLIMFVFRYYKKEIKFYRDIIIYFKLFPIEFSFIEETKKKELKNKYYAHRRDKEKNDKMNNIDNSSNKINKISNENKKHSKNIRMGKSKQFKKENRNIKNTENTKETPSLNMKFKGNNLKSNHNKKKKQINSKDLKNNIKEEDDLNKKIKLEKKLKKNTVLINLITQRKCMKFIKKYIIEQIMN